MLSSHTNHYLKDTSKGADGRYYADLFFRKGILTDNTTNETTSDFKTKNDGSIDTDLISDFFDSPKKLNK